MTASKESSLYRILLVLAFLQILSVGSSQLMTSLHAKSLGISPAVIGVLVSIFWIGRLVADIPIGRLVDIFGVRLPIVLSLIVSAMASALFAASVDAIHLLASRIVWGVATSLFYVASISVVTRAYSGHKQGERIGIMQAVDVSGLMAGAGISGFFSEALGVISTFALLTISLLVAALGASLMPVLKRTRSQKRIMGSFQLKGVLNRDLLLAGLIGVPLFSNNTSLAAFMIQLYGTDLLGLGPSFIGLFLMLRAAGLMAGSLTGGHSTNHISPRIILALCIPLTSSIVHAASLATSVAVFGLLMFLLGAITGAAFAMLPLIAAAGSAPEQRGTAIGVQRTFNDIGSILGPIALAASVQLWGLSSSFQLSALAVLASLPLALMIRSGRMRAP